MKKIFKTILNGKELVVETGEVAKQANGSVIVKYDDTVVLTTAAASKDAKDVDFFPLTVAFEEKLYSVGRIPGSFLRREGRPGEHATLSARLIDRTLRPIFDEGFRNEVQVVNTILSVNQDAAPEVLAMLGSSLALSISDIPFNQPIAGVIVGLIDGEFILNPTLEQSKISLINLAVAGTKEAINMVEASAKEVDEETMLKAIEFGHENIKKLIAFQEEVIKEIGKNKINVTIYEINPEVQNFVNKNAKNELEDIVKNVKGKLEKYQKIDQVKERVINLFEEKTYLNDKEKNNTIKQAKDALELIVRNEVRRLITEEKIRPDGRGIEEIRPLNSQIDILPRVHGSALFTRGETQVLSITTLGVEDDEQIIENLTIEDSKRFMHHYNFPPFSVGEVGRMGTPGRREIGHGALGEKALSQVIPSVEDFPYTIRVVSEVLESNGSSSQASICASSMSLMAAGVPIKNPVSGIAMGLVSNGNLLEGASYTILSDIQGLEDHLGDMDFKVAGTKDGITALQMDIKIVGITSQILKQALFQANKGRAFILKNMTDVISKSRDRVSEYAPKVETMRIDIDQIREVIGSGGKVINDIIEKSGGVKIDISDEGIIHLYHSSFDNINKARKMIEKITRKAEIGEVYDGVVVAVENFGAFVQIFEGTDGLVHVSKMKNERVENPKDVVQIGDKVRVKVINIDEKGRVNLSMKDA